MPNTRIFRLWPLILFTLLLAATLRPASAQSAGQPFTPRFAGDKGVRERLIREPVFNGACYIAEAGRPEAPLLILVHGVGDNASLIWNDLLPDLARRYHVVTFDLPGFGQSEKQNALYSPGNYARFIRWVSRQYSNGAPFILVGHSLGGAISLRYAADYPEDLTRLVLVDAAGILHRNAFAKGFLKPNLKERMPDAPREPVIFADNLARAAIDFIPNIPLDLDEVLNNPLLRGTVLGGAPPMIASVALIQEDFSPSLDRVRTPTWLIWGIGDEVAPLRTARALETRLPKTGMFLVPGAAHVPMNEQPALFRARLEQALSDPSPAERLDRLTPQDRVGRCSNQSGVTFRGGYDRVEISGCTDVLIEEVAAREVVIVDSNVTINSCRITSEGTGLLVRNSKVEGAGISVRGKEAMRVVNSRLDLAGAYLEGREGAVVAEGISTILFSVSKTSSARGKSILHGVYRFTADTPL